MPDPTRKTISATQVPALFNVSPWLTRWMLYRNFVDGMPIENEGDARMEWGRRMEPLILDVAARDLNLEVRPDQAYVRRGRIGCTRDAIVTAPDVGPGALESKCVFDYRTWMSDWEGGKSVPRHYELQLQVQMAVGDGTTPFKWGAIAAWVAGEVHYFKREPIPELWEQIEREAEDFFASVERRNEPDPFGAAIELPLLTTIPRSGEVLDLSDDLDLAEIARSYTLDKEAERTAAKAAEIAKVKLLAAMGAASEAALYGGIHVRLSQRAVAAHQRKASTSTVVKVHVPEHLADGLALTK